MDKPYFTKYLPVEEETEEGDYYISHLHTTPEKMGGINLWSFPIQKVKLFLCSRDIQIGDKVRKQDSEEFEWTMMMDSCIPSDKVFKVLGEVSPQAIWVKEGDEFSEEEIGIQTFYTYDENGSGLRSGLAKVGESIFVGGRGVITSIDKVIVLIKCPTCGTFH